MSIPAVNIPPPGPTPWESFREGKSSPEKYKRLHNLGQKIMCKKSLKPIPRGETRTQDIRELQLKGTFAP